MAKKKKSAFSYFLGIYILILLIAMLALFFYVRSVMIEYENSTPDKFILSEIASSGKNDGSIGEYLQDTCFDQNSLGNSTQRSKTYYQKITSTKLEVTKSSKNSTNDLSAYNVTSDGKPFLTIWLSKDEVVNKLGLLNIPKWSIKNVVLRSETSKESYASVDEDGTYSFDIVYPKDFVLAIEGSYYTPSEDDEEVELKPFNGFYDGTIYSENGDVPMGIKAKISGLYFEPSINVYNNAGEEVLVEKGRDNIYYASVEYAESEEAKSILTSNVNLKEVSQTWVDFMLNDVGGETHGLSKVVSSCKLSYDSPQYKKAREWATQVDITFVSTHYETTKVNYKETNFVMYNDKLISCDVYFETNIPLTTGRVRTDVFNNRMFFYYMDATQNQSEGWYWIGSYSLAE